MKVDCGGTQVVLPSGVIHDQVETVMRAFFAAGC